MLFCSRRIKMIREQFILDKGILFLNFREFKHPFSQIWAVIVWQKKHYTCIAVQRAITADWQQWLFAILFCFSVNLDRADHLMQLAVFVSSFHAYFLNNTSEGLSAQFSQFPLFGHRSQYFSQRFCSARIATAQEIEQPSETYVDPSPPDFG